MHHRLASRTLRLLSRAAVALAVLLVMAPVASAAGRQPKPLPAPVEAGLRRAVQAIHRGDLAAAQAEYERLSREHPEVGPVWAGLGVVRDARGDVPGAILAFQRLVALTPDSAAAHNNLGWELYRSNRVVEAQDQFVQAIRLDPSHRRARLNLGLCFLKQGSAELALAEFLVVQKRLGDDDAVEVDLGLAYQATRRFGFAETAYRNAIRLNPGSVEARINLGILLGALGREAEALPVLTEAMKLPASPVAHSMAQNALASLTWSKGDAPRALALWREALKTDPANEIAADNLARAELLAKAGDRTEARAIYERLARRHPDNARILTCLGAARWATGDAAGAVRAYHRALTLDPDSAAANLGLGMVEEAQHRPDDAFEHFFRAVELAPDSALAHYRLARSYAAQRLWKAATAELQRALQLDPRFAEVARADQALEALRARPECRALLENLPPAGPARLAPDHG